MIHPSNRVLFWRPEDQKKGIIISFKFRYEKEQFVVRTERPKQQKVLEEALPKLKQFMRKKVDDEKLSIEPSNLEFLKESTTIDELDLDLRIDSLLVNGNQFKIIRNACPIRGVVLTHLPMSGFQCMPNISLNDPKTGVECHWFVRDSTGMLKKGEQLKVDYLDEENRTFSVKDFEFRGKGPFFVPEERDLGKIVAVIVENGEDFPAFVATSSQPVAKGPELVTDCQIKFLKENRLEEKSKIIRAASYNILADHFLDLNLPQEKLTFDYCPKNFQRIVYRTPLLLKQLADLINGQTSLIFLQEVDLSRKEHFIRPFLSQFGFRSEVAKKEEKKGRAGYQGTAVVFDEQRFELLGSDTFRLADLVMENHPDLLAILSTSDVSKRTFLKKSTVVQIVRLFDKITGRTLICANTHLHSNPKNEHLKVLQSMACIRKIFEEYHRVEGNNKSLVFGGDFNSLPDGPVFQLMSQAHLP